MRKILCFGLFAILLALGATVQAQGATNASVTEWIYPEGTDGILKITWVGRPDEQGNIYLPAPQGKVIWRATEVKGGALTANKPSEVSLAGAKLYFWQLVPSANEMTLIVTYTLPDFFLVKDLQVDPDGALTQRGDIRTFKYGFENKLPAVIDNYSLTVTLPKGNEAFRVIAPKKYVISAKSGAVQISASLKGKEGSPALLPGKSSNMAFEYVETGHGTARLWLAIAALSAIFLICRRDVLKAAGGAK